MYRSSKPRTISRCDRSLPYAILVACALVTLGAAQPALATLACGPRPDVAAAKVTPEFEGDIVGTAKLIHHASPSSNLRGLVTAQRRELRQKYPDIEKPLLDSYLVWITCQTIAKDPNLAPAQGFDENAMFYRLLTEPIDKGGSSKHE